MAPNSDWDWEFTDQAERQFSNLTPRLQDRIIEKLNDVVTNEWRDPPDFLEPIRNSPYEKLRVGDYRLGCIVDSETSMITVGSIRPRDSAYDGDD